MFRQFGSNFSTKVLLRFKENGQSLESWYSKGAHESSAPSYLENIWPLLCLSSSPPRHHQFVFCFFKARTPKANRPVDRANLFLPSVGHFTSWNLLKNHLIWSENLREVRIWTMAMSKTASGSCWNCGCLKILRMPTWIMEDRHIFYSFLSINHL